MLDAVVVGAGWAGLGVSHALTLQGVRHQVLERGRIGETWRTQRWDSFRLNTPNVQTVMPGDRYTGHEADGMMTADAFVNLLEDFARRHALQPTSARGHPELYGKLALVLKEAGAPYPDPSRADARPEPQTR